MHAESNSTSLLARTAPHVIAGRLSALVGWSRIFCSRLRKKVVAFDFQIPDTYDWSQSTRANYRDDNAGFWGIDKEGDKIPSIRETRDHSYHGNYEKRRQELQNLLIADVVKGGASGADTRIRKDKWIIFTAGAMGAGKGHVVNWMWQHGHFHLPDYVRVDFDQFRERLPEWGGYRARDPETAGTLTHKECGFCVEIAQELALDAGKNVWIDGSLQDHAWYAAVFSDIRKRYSDYKIAILYVFADDEAVIARAKRRAEVTGRRVPEATLRNAIKRTAQAIAHLAPLADFAARIQNLPSNSQHPTNPRVLCPIVNQKGEFIPYQSGEGGDNWFEIRRRFATIKVDRETLNIMFNPIIDGHDIVIFAKSYCTFSARLILALRQAKLPYEVVELDQLRNGLEIQMWLKCKSQAQMSTTPQVFVKGAHIGGCDDTLSELASGRLAERLAQQTAAAGPA